MACVWAVGAATGEERNTDHWSVLPCLARTDLCDLTLVISQRSLPSKKFQSHHLALRRIIVSIRSSIPDRLASKHVDRLNTPKYCTALWTQQRLVVEMATFEEFWLGILSRVSKCSVHNDLVSYYFSRGIDRKINEQICTNLFIRFVSFFPLSCRLYKSSSHQKCFIKHILQSIAPPLGGIAPCSESSS